MSGLVGHRGVLSRHDSGSDPHFANVLLLLNGESLIDLSSYNRPLTRSGAGVSIDAEHAAAGFGACISFDGTAFLQAPASPDWDLDGTGGSTDWTIELTVAWSALVAETALLSASAAISGAASDRGWICLHGSAGASGVTSTRSLDWIGVTSNGFTYPNVRQLLAGNALPTEPAGFYDLCWAKKGTGAGGFWLNGTALAVSNPAGGGTSLNNNTSYASVPLRMGVARDNASSPRGQFRVQRARVTRGVARYTPGTNYSVPAGPFPTR